MNRYEEAFLQAEGDAYCIYQLKLTDETAKLLFMSSDYLRKHDMEPAYEDYDAVYSGVLPVSREEYGETLDKLFMKFNADRPQDFTGRRLSVSDIIALKRGTLMSAHYVDSVGFTSVPDFMARKLMEAAAKERHTSD